MGYKTAKLFEVDRIQYFYRIYIQAIYVGITVANQKKEKI